MKIAVVGATGMVGRKMLQVLDERNFDFETLILAASENSAGKIIAFRQKEYEVVTVETALAQRPDIALFSAGAGTSKNWARKFADAGTFVIDNSSAWRMFDDVPLVVPEINGDAIKSSGRLIANPNCSTIQMVVALAPLHKAFRIKRIVVSTYQSVTGSGMRGSDQLGYERADLPVIPFYPYQIDLNLIESVVFAIGNALGFSLAILIFSSLREQLDEADLPEYMKGVPAALITAGILAMAFMGFAGIV
ncbi:MAG: aspartate-semialdehyde dehydrogenase [Cyclobacteriaceae bacterium]|nr:aspartate-semialdehyde dehydrogenase [Cyclobacteriaceae bacterium]